MISPDTTIHSFIVKIWVEDSLESPNERRWHGYVTHVPSGKRIYLAHLEDVVTFIQRLVGNDNAGNQSDRSQQDP